MMWNKRFFLGLSIILGVMAGSGIGSLQSFASPYSPEKKEDSSPFPSPEKGRVDRQEESSFKEEEPLKNSRSALIDEVLKSKDALKTKEFPPEKKVDYILADEATIGVLDKITGRIESFKLKSNEEKKFEQLAIRLQKCYTTRPEDEPDAVGLLQIKEISKEKEEKELFSGWMFASSPSLSSLEHAVYDVWMINCSKVSSSLLEPDRHDSAHVKSFPIDRERKQKALEHPQGKVVTTF